MGKLVKISHEQYMELLAMPTHCSRPHGNSGMRDSAGGPDSIGTTESFHCEHLRLLFKDKTVECRSCGREWKDMGTGQ
jgi:hypothetical protein